MLSERLIVAIKLWPGRQYRLAQQIGVHPGTLSAWINRIHRPRTDDPRVAQLAALVGVPVQEALETSGQSSLHPPAAATERRVPEMGGR
jgi:hypothetical protein